MSKSIVHLEERSLVEFNEEVDELLTKLGANGKAADIPPELFEAIEEVAQTLGPFLPWWVAAPTALLPPLKKWLAGKKFRKLLGLVFLYAVNPQTSLRNLEVADIIRFGKANKLEVEFGLAEEILLVLPYLLDTAEVRAIFSQLGLDRYLAFVQRRVRLSTSIQNEFVDDYMSIQVADALVATMELVIAPEPGDVEEVLKNVSSICKLRLDNPKQSVDANLMLPIVDRQAAWAHCQHNKDAVEVFRQDMYEAADTVLHITHSTNQTFNGFWAPTFADTSRNMPGAAAAYCHQIPEVVFTRFPPPFGNGLTAELQQRVMTYLANVRFHAFLSFPILRSDGCIGVVNINLAEDELRFYDRREVQRLYHRVRPLLSTLEHLLTT